MKLFMKIAWKMYGTFYRWGGDDPSGFDCSGMVIECLKSVGMMKENEDTTAHGLWTKYQNYEEKHPYEGCLVFWFRDSKAYHVAICIDHEHCLTADGGGSTTITMEDAIKQNAFIKVRRIDKRTSTVKFANIF